MSKKLVRVDEGSMLAGVCTGLAQYFDLDIAIIRVIALILLCSGFGFIPYIICWLAIPSDV